MNQALAKRKSNSINRSPLAGLLHRDLFSQGLFDDFFDQYLTDTNGDLAQMMSVSMDVAETDQAFEVHVDLPGIKVEEVDIQIDNNTLTIRGQRAAD